MKLRPFILVEKTYKLGTHHFFLVAIDEDTTCRPYRLWHEETEMYCFVDAPFFASARFIRYMTLSEFIGMQHRPKYPNIENNRTMPIPEFGL